ncbi:hypothetical protein LJC44_02620, partial [Parabacteroides sp. OttesenSCG-928-G06]|nr:hypothetical protein [Parabacteroides sp. OttesenSCG-928-G06]
KTYWLSGILHTFGTHVMMPYQPDAKATGYQDYVPSGRLGKSSNLTLSETPIFPLSKSGLIHQFISQWGVCLTF